MLRWTVMMQTRSHPPVLWISESLLETQLTADWHQHRMKYTIEIVLASFLSLSHLLIPLIGASWDHLSHQLLAFELYQNLFWAITKNKVIADQCLKLNALC